MIGVSLPELLLSNIKMIKNKTRMIPNLKMKMNKSDLPNYKDISYNIILDCRISHLELVIMLVITAKSIFSLYQKKLGLVLLSI